MTRRKINDRVAAAIARQFPDQAHLVGKEPKPAPVKSRVPPSEVAAPSAPNLRNDFAAKRPKFGNVKTTDPETGEVFDSKLEHRVYRALVSQYGTRNVMRQWSMALPGGVRIRPDFVVLSEPQADHASKPPRPRAILAVIDAKGMAPTRDWTNKAKMLYALTGINIAIANTPEDALRIVEATKAGA